MNNSTSLCPTKPIFMQSERVSRQVYTFNIEKYKDAGTRLSAVSIQGIVNRKTPELFILNEDIEWCLEYYTKKDYIDTVTEIPTLDELFKRYAKYMKGAVVIDPDKDFTVNTATNIAGSESRVIISPDMVETVKSYGITDIKDIRDLGFKNAAEAYKWEKEHYFKDKCKDALCCLYYSRFTDPARDYVIEFNIHSFWVAGKQDDDYDPEMVELVTETLKETPANIPVYGFWQNGERGLHEFPGVRLGGYYGKFTAVNVHVGNYSFHSGIPADVNNLKQSKIRNKTEKVQYDPNKKYVALIMIESGDAPVYFQGLFQRYQWWDPIRGSFPISYGITPSLRYLAPGILQNLYETMTEEDFFFGSISGIGYCYPLEGFASKCDNPEAVLNEYYERTAAEFSKMDIDMFGLYSHTWTPWKKEDDEYINKYLTKYPQFKSIIADMGRNDNMAKPHVMLDNDTSVHHTVTRWSWDQHGAPFTTEHDIEARDFLVNEILENSKDQQFIQAMFYSWFYGPRRLKMAVDILKEKGYEFVSLIEMDELWRNHGQN